MDYIKIAKKDGRIEDFDSTKIVEAIRKSAERVGEELTNEDECSVVAKTVVEIMNRKGDEKVVVVPVEIVHKMVERNLLSVNPKAGDSYRSYRNYKTEFVGMLDKIFKQSHSALYLGDKENSNADSSLASTKQSLIRGYLTKELYEQTFLTKEELQACNDGAIYIHDRRDRLFGINCCLADIGSIMNGGFEMGNLWYNQPKTLDVAFDVMGDVIMSMAPQGYGGYSVPQIDSILEPYCELSYTHYVKEFESVAKSLPLSSDAYSAQAHSYAMSKIKRDLEQGFQGLEMKLNSVASSRGDYIFTTFTFGLNVSQFGQMITEAILKVRKEGQGKDGFKKVVTFPKLVFLYTDELHGEGKPYEHLFDKAIECSAKAMYPDYTSLDGEHNYLATMYHKYGGVVSPMGE